MPLAPILFLLIFLLGIAGIIWLFYTFNKKQNIWGMAVLAGLFSGSFLWLAILFWVVFPVVSAVFIVLTLLVGFVLFKINLKVFEKGILSSMAVLAVMLLVWQGILSYWLNIPVVSDLEVLNLQGKQGDALVVYHPGKSDFQEQITVAFAQGLVDEGWRVDITTVSPAAPENLTGYDLLVLGAPTYDWKPANRIKRYLDRLENIQGKPVVVLVSAAGYSQLSQPTFETWVKDAGGNLIGSYALWTMAPNEEVYGISDPLMIMKQAASDTDPEQ